MFYSMLYLCVMYIYPKKALGQHFLKDASIAQRIVEALCSACRLPPSAFRPLVLEVGPGKGILTQFLLEQPHIDLRAVEIDREAVDHLLLRFPTLHGRLIQADFLKLNLAEVFPQPFLVIGNFPYNISSQIFFKVLDNRDLVPVVVGMLQKEVAERIAAPPGSKTYGILSVLLQAWYSIEYLFTVPPHVFDPPPKVQSAVVRITRNSRLALSCSEALFTQVVKATFNQRRKAIRNSIKQITGSACLPDHPLLSLRPEHLGVEQFVELTHFVASILS